MTYQVVWPNLNVGTNEDGSAKVAKRGDRLEAEDFPLDVGSLVVVGAIQPLDEVPVTEESVPEPKTYPSATSSKAQSSGKTLAK